MLLRIFNANRMKVTTRAEQHKLQDKRINHKIMQSRSTCNPLESVI